MKVSKPDPLGPAENTTPPKETPREVVKKTETTTEPAIKRAEPAQDLAEISVQSLLLSRLLHVPEVREHRIAQIKQKIARGELLRPPNLKNGIISMIIRNELLRKDPSE